MRPCSRRVRSCAPCPSPRADSTTRDRILGLAGTIGAATERPQLFGNEETLVSIGPPKEERPLAEPLERDQSFLRRSRPRRDGGLIGRPGPCTAGVAGAMGTHVAIGKDALVPISPTDADRIAADLLQGLERQ